MMTKWIYKEDELPSAYEDIEVLLKDGSICKEMIIRSVLGMLLWSNHNDSDIVCWRTAE